MRAVGRFMMGGGRRRSWVETRRRRSVLTGWSQSYSREGSWGGKDGGAVVGLGGAARAWLLQVGVRSTVVMRRRRGRSSRGAGARSRRCWRRPVGGVLPIAVTEGEAAVNQQREFRNGRLKSTSLKRQTLHEGEEPKIRGGGIRDEEELDVRGEESVILAVSDLRWFRFSQ